MIRPGLLGVAVALIAVTAWIWIDARRVTGALRSEVAEKLTAVDATLAQARARESQSAAELREAQAKVALLETRLSESQSQQSALESLYRDLAPSRDELALAEIEQTLSLASQQLAVAANVPAALAALQLADAKLARIDRPRFAPLRRALASDMERLKAVPFVDTAAIAGKLDAAIAAADTLPLARDERLPAPAPPLARDGEPSWQRAIAELWAELKGLVRVEVSDRPAPPLVAPSQQYYLRENLRLRLLSARLALIARNETAFLSDVRAAEAWIRRYFDVRAKPVAAVQASLAAMSGISMPVEVPDITRSLDAARALRLVFDARADAPRGK
ncbi:MAG: uroporphyrinogen-III C-methyltransferase [Burkholderiales bacterium]